MTQPSALSARLLARLNAIREGLAGSFPRLRADPSCPVLGALPVIILGSETRVLEMMAKIAAANSVLYTTSSEAVSFVVRFAEQK